MADNPQAGATPRRHVVRRHLAAPLGALAGGGAMLRAEAACAGLGAIGLLDAVADAAGALPGLLDRLAEAGEAEARAALVDALERLGGDARTLFEGLAGPARRVLAADLEALVGEVDRLLPTLDAVAELAARSGGDLPDASAELVAELLRGMAGGGEAGFESGHILVVDDDAGQRHALALRLARDGHDVITAAGAAEAMDILAREEVDAVMLDLEMPYLEMPGGGYELLEYIKSDPDLSRVPVIMTAGPDEAPDTAQCVRMGAEDVLQKPFDPVLLRARLSSSLDRKRLRDRERQYLVDIHVERERSARLLLNVLPAQVVERLNAGETVIAETFDDVTVLFADLVGFTEVSSRFHPDAVVDSLNHLFSEFDRLARRFGIEKIKTIGDCYMACAGVPEPMADHAEAALAMAYGMVATADRLAGKLVAPMRLRVGLHSGPVVGGIIGTQKFAYDVWGDTVNVASRLEGTSRPGVIQLSEETVRRLPATARVTPRGKVELKGKGPVMTYFADPDY